MKKLISIIFLSVLILQACGDDITRFRKDRVIPEPALVDILVDIHLMDAITNGSGFYRKYEGIDSVDIYSNIFQKHGVSKADFDTTVAIYSRQPDLYLQVYDKVMLKLNLRIDELTAENDSSAIQETKSQEEIEQEFRDQPLEKLKSKL
jgi:hypothetical protein